MLLCYFGTYTLVLIVVVLMLIGVASAERENAQVNGFSVSFDLNQPQDTVVDNGDGINVSVASAPKKYTVV